MQQKFKTSRGADQYSLMIFLWNTVSQPSRSAGNIFSTQIQVFCTSFQEFYQQWPSPLFLHSSDVDRTAESRGWRDRNAGRWQPTAFVGNGNKRMTRFVFLFHFLLSSSSLKKNWTGQKQGKAQAMSSTMCDTAVPCPAPGTGLVKYKLLKMSSTQHRNCNKHLNWMTAELVNRRTVQSIKKLCPST